MEELQAELEYRFRNLALLELALTHPSWVNEHGKDGLNNQRLEFLGDAVLELCISRELYHRYPTLREGPLTQMRGQLVNETSLAALARELNLPDKLRIGRGEEAQGGREKDSILSDAVEAILAAIYEDGGFVAAHKAVCKLFARHWPAISFGLKEKDPKSRLQEFCQKEYRENPVYSLLATAGPDHAKTFTTQLTLPTGQSFCASSSSCKKAEQAAAAMALGQLEK